MDGRTWGLWGLRKCAYDLNLVLEINPTPPHLYSMPLFVPSISAMVVQEHSFSKLSKSQMGVRRRCGNERI